MAPLAVQADACLVHMPSPLLGFSGGAGCDLFRAYALALAMLAWPL